MIEYLPQALSSLSVAISIGKSLISIHDTTRAQEQFMKFNEAIIDAQNKIISARNEHSLMASKIQELEKECVRLKDWSAEKKNYVLKQIAPGVFAYIEKGTVTSFSDAHKLCCNCFGKTIKSTLQQGEVKTHARMISLTCPNGCPQLQFRYYNEIGK